MMYVGVGVCVAVDVDVRVGVPVTVELCEVDKVAVAVVVGVRVALDDAVSEPDGVVVKLLVGDVPNDLVDVIVSDADGVCDAVSDALAVTEALAVLELVHVAVAVELGVGSAGASAMPWNCAAGAAANARGAPPNSHVSVPVLNAYIALGVTAYSVAPPTASAACT